MAHEFPQIVTKLEPVEQARRRLLAFTTYTKPDYNTNWHHGKLAEALDRVARGECRRLMIFMPPQHGKSELVSRRFPAFMLGRNPDLRLICACHTTDLAESMNRDVQRIMTSDLYAQVFPEVALDGASPRLEEGPATSAVDSSGPTGEGPGVRGRVRRRRKFVARRTMELFEIPGHRGSLRTAGVNKPISGYPADGAIIDDPFGKREDAESPNMRQHVWDWYTGDLYPRLSADAWIVLTHTRWHRDDLAGRLLRVMASRAADQWEILCLPAVRTEGPADPADDRQPGEVLWPSFKSAAELDIIRQQDVRTYAALYQQNPADASGAEWAPELFGDWIWVPPEKWPAEFDVKFVCLDASKGRHDKQGDYSAIVFVGLKNRILYVDAVLERIPLDQIVRKMILFCDEKQPQHVGIEAEQFQELLVHEFRRQSGDRFRPSWTLHEMVTEGVPKVSRIRRLSQFVINRELRFKADSPGCRLLVDQLMDFPLADHDDGPDALEMCTRITYHEEPPRETVTWIPLDVGLRLMETGIIRL